MTNHVWVQKIFGVVVIATVLISCSNSKKQPAREPFDPVAVPAEQPPAGTAHPTDFGFAAPVPAPALPPVAESFFPKAIKSSSSDLAIAEYTRTAGAGESVVLTGVGFDPSQTKLRVFGQDGSGVYKRELAPFQIRPLMMSMTLPSDLPSWGMSLFWVQNGENYSEPVAVNKTEAWWTNPQRAVVGETVALMGRNLARNNGTSTAAIYIKPAHSEALGLWARTTSVNPYRVEFELPNLMPGEYEVWAHNTHGGQFGWSEPMRIEVLASSPWAGQDSKTFNVKDFGATGNGSTDDTAAIQKAILAASESAPATVYFPAGTYIVSGEVPLRERLRLLGDGRDKTFIRASSAFSGIALLFTNAPGSNNTHVTQLTLDRGQGSFDRVVHLRYGKNIKMTDVRIDGRLGNVLDIHSSNGVILNNVELIGTGTFLGSAQNVSINQSTVLGRNDGDVLLFCWGCDNVAVTNSEARDYDPSMSTGAAKGRFFVTQAHWGASENIYFAGNTTTDFAPRNSSDVDQNSGEQFLIENAWTYTSVVSSGTENTVTLPNYRDGDPLGNEVVIIEGRGVGQHRRIVGYDSATGTLTVFPAFRVAPDSSSKVAVAPSVARAVVYNNSLDGAADYATRYMASAGVNVWGNANDLIIANNHFNNMRGAISLFALSSNSEQLIPSYFNTIVDNRLTNSRSGLEYVAASNENMSSGYGLLGTIYRGNSIDNMSDTAIGIWGQPHKSGGDFGPAIFEKNHATNVANGFQSPETLTKVHTHLLLNNRFERGNAPLSGSQGIHLGNGQEWHASGNKASGFSSDNSL